MNGYAPHDPMTLVLVGVLAAATLWTGLMLAKLPVLRWSRPLAWVIVIAAVVGVERLCRDEPAGIRMLAIILVLLWSMKGVVTVESRKDGMRFPSSLRWLGFAALWPGMRPAPFAAPRKKLQGGWPLFGMGCLYVLSGAAHTGAAWFVWHQGRAIIEEDAACMIATLLLLVGLSMMLHFGAFNILAGLWRTAGVDVRPLFRAPLASRSLDVFWSRRWNLAFSEMTALAVYRPVAGRLGRNAAIFAAFLASGILHELAISVPVMAGLGGPMAYFVLQAVLIGIERRFERAGRPVSNWGAWSHVWVLGWLAIPAPILFHHAFLTGTVWPLIGLE